MINKKMILVIVMCITHDHLLFNPTVFFFGYKIEKPNLSVYVCKAHFQRLKPWPFLPTPNKHLYL